MRVETTVISCMMIEALMYGFTPMAMIENRDNPPPENRSRRPRKALLWKSRSSCCLFAPGTAMFARIRKTTKSPSVKRIFRRSSGMRKAFPIASNIG